MCIAGGMGVWEGPRRQRPDFQAGQPQGTTWGNHGRVTSGRPLHLGLCLRVTARYQGEGTVST